eukprot:354266-Chlamydomonas_euryale.AAC.17
MAARVSRERYHAQAPNACMHSLYASPSRHALDREQHHMHAIRTCSGRAQAYRVSCVLRSAPHAHPVVPGVGENGTRVREGGGEGGREEEKGAGRTIPGSGNSTCCVQRMRTSCDRLTPSTAAAMGSDDSKYSVGSQFSNPGGSWSEFKLAGLANHCECAVPPWHAL